MCIRDRHSFVPTLLLCRHSFCADTPFVPTLLFDSKSENANQNKSRKHILKKNRQAPSELFELGEGEAELSIIFEDQDGGVWSSYNSVLRPPEIDAHNEPEVPQWALSMAWTGASLTVILTVIGAIVLRRDRLT